MSGPLTHEKQAPGISPRQHEDASADLRQEGPKQQPQRRKIVGTRLNGAPAPPTLTVCHPCRVLSPDFHDALRSTMATAAKLTASDHRSVANGPGNTCRGRPPPSLMATRRETAAAH